ncbi:hypothetical protein F4859DRAFT_512113 [Xylaria cf. heliscus]|nr:hypothetical protein F4859DRAFT_512113 [Xylaria cf. heliscus]
MPYLNTPLNSNGPADAADATDATDTADGAPASSTSPTSLTTNVVLPPTSSVLHGIHESSQSTACESFEPSPYSIPGPAGRMAHPLVPRQDNTGVGAGPGPLRHPRPLTAAELHQQLEQEQEMIVNRLSRDLTLLRRAQNSSVVSNTSSTSASTSTADQLLPSSFTDSHLLSGPGFPVPTSRRHHRTSSSASARSVSVLANQGSSTSTTPAVSSHSGSAAVLEAARNPRGPTGMSRQNSTTSHRSSSRNRSPQPHIGSSGPLPSSHSQPHGLPDSTSGYFHRDRASSNASIAATPASDLSPGLLPATLRYEEAIHYRNELEAAKRENEALKKRVRTLEKLLRERRESDSESGRARNEGAIAAGGVSMSGTAGIGGVVGGGTGIASDRREERKSMRQARDMAVGVPQQEVRVGESAAGAGGAPNPSSPGTESTSTDY